MPRIPRNIENASFFHVMVQGIEKRNIFDGPENMERYISIMEYKSKQQKISIVAYCMMDNHAHILVKVKNTEELVTFFRCVNTSYAKYFNKINKRVGYVFRDRYKSKPIISVKQLINTINYIHRNPVDGEICNNVEKYEYSSYNEYFKNKPQIIDKKILLKYFDKKSFKKLFKIKRR